MHPVATVGEEFIVNHGRRWLRGGAEGQIAIASWATGTQASHGHWWAVLLKKWMDQIMKASNVILTALPELNGKF